MTARTTKPKCVLLDANVVIEAHRVAVWRNLLDQCQIMVPSTVVRDEALFYSCETDGIHEDIYLPKLVHDGRIIQLTATAEDLVNLYGTFDRVFVEGIDPGEAEALALLKSGKAPEAYFCTGDAPAIRALAMLGMSERGISMEMLLRKLGLQRRLQHFGFTEEFFQENLKRGSINRVTGEGLAGGGLIS